MLAVVSAVACASGKSDTVPGSKGHGSTDLPSVNAGDDAGYAPACSTCSPGASEDAGSPAPTDDAGVPSTPPDDAAPVQDDSSAPPTLGDDASIPPLTFPDAGLGSPPPSGDASACSTKICIDPVFDCPLQGCFNGCVNFQCQ